MATPPPRDPGRSNRGGSNSTPAGTRGNTTLDPFDEGFMQRLALLEVASRRVLSGRQRAERKTRKTGSGLEFADHREYSPGDDIRNVDWGVLGRLDQTLVRLYEEDEDLPIRLVVDVSDSMRTRGASKLRHAMRIAAALAYVGLANLDRVAITCASGEVHTTLPAARGKGRIFKILDFLRAATLGGPTNVRAMCTKVAAESREPGIVVVLSDFYDLEGAFEGLNLLRFRKHDAVCVQVLDPAEADPRRMGVRGDVTLVDVESGGRRDLTLSRASLDAFARAHEAFCRKLEADCRSRGIAYARAETDVELEEIVLGLLRRGGIVR